MSRSHLSRKFAIPRAARVSAGAAVAALALTTMTAGAAGADDGTGGSGGGDETARGQSVSTQAAPQQAVQKQAGPEQEMPAASGSVGEVDVEQNGTPVHVGPIAECGVDRPPEGSTPGVEVGESGDLATYGRGGSSCALPEGSATAETSGERFSTSVLEEYGGPELRVRSFSAECRAEGNGSTSSMQLSGVSGFDIPEEIPPNHEVLVPGANEGDPPMARVVLNASTTPDPPDGSMELSAARIELFPDGGPVTGDIELGSVSCDPYGD